MNTRAITACLVAVVLTGCNSTSVSRSTPAGSTSAEREWQEEFGLSDCGLVPAGQNPFFILEPGFQLSFAGEDGELTITVLDETLKIGGESGRTAI